MMEGADGGLFFDVENLLETAQDDEIPDDLLLLAAFACENKFSNLYINPYAPVLDILPVYEKEGNALISVGKIADRLGIEKTKSLHMGPGEPLVDSISIDRNQLDLPVGTTSLEDADYEADEGGVWIGIGDASVRVVLNENCVMADIYARGREDIEPLSSALVDNRDLKDTIADNPDLDDNEDSPQPM